MWDERFETLVRKQVGLSADEPLDPDVRVSDLGLDSIGMVNLLVEIEQAFDVVFTDDLLTPSTFVTPGALWRTVSGLLATSG
jgi:acyl carrier protein